jgi:circadian clock protein KaiC
VTTGEAIGGGGADTGPVVPSGVPNLDLVLGGGIRRGAVAMVIGPPGAGKTILAQQVTFAAARRGEPVLYLTGYSETHEKLMAYNRDMRFFDAGMIPERVQFASLAELLQRGPDQAEAAVVATARGHRARLVVLDGFGSMRRLLPNEAAAAAFVYSIGAKLAYLGATTLIVLEGDPDATSRFGELTVSDAVVSLRRERLGTRHRRVLEVLKARGSAPLGGLHPFTIGDAGVHIHPRLESLPPGPDAPWRSERAGLGAPGVDALTGGGLTEGTTTLVAGSLGTGKTLLGLHFLVEGARRGEAALYLGFLETAPQLREQARVFGLDLAGAEAAGRVRLLVLPAYEVEPDRVAELVRADVEARGVRRLVVDSVNELQRSLAPAGRQPEFFAALVGYLRARAVTSILALEVARIVGELELADSALRIVAENLLVLRQTEYRGAMRRLLSILKMRFSAHDRAIHDFTIAAGRGIEVVGPAPTAVGLLAGVARPLDGEPSPRRPARPRG